MTKRFLLLIIAVPLLVGPAAAQAFGQAEGITLAAEVGFDGYYRRGEWTPVRVTVANSGPDVEGFVVVEQSGNAPSAIVRYQAPLILPRQSRKMVTLYVGIDKYQSGLKVELVSGSRTLAEQRVPITQVGGEDSLYAVVSGEPVDLSVLERVGTPGQRARVAYIALDQLPAVGPAWDALDVLILNDTDTGVLSLEQLGALRAWLAAGGHLVVTGGPGWRKTAAGLDELLPVSISGSVSSRGLDALSELTGVPVGEGPFVVAQGELRSGSRPMGQGGRVFLAQDDLPLLVRRSEGLGNVDWLALDLALAPLRDWAGGERLWATIMSGSSSRTLWQNSTVNHWAAREGLKAIPSLALPSALQMVLFLAVYTTLIGPVNYAVLRRANRRELAWFTVPAVVLLFSGLAYATGFQIRGSDVVLNRLSLVYGAAGAESARARSLVGVFSPSRSTYDVFFPAGALVRPLGQDMSFGAGDSATVEQSDRIVLRDLQVDVSGLRAFSIESDVAPPAIEGGLTIEVAGRPRLTGELTNGETSLLSTGLLLGDTVVELGDLAPGETVSVDTQLAGGRAAYRSPGSGAGGLSAVYPAYPPGYLPLDQLVGGSNHWNDKRLHRRFQTLQAFLSSQGPGISPPGRAIFFGWSEEPLWGIDVKGKASQTLDTVGYFLELPLAIASTQGEVVLPAALTIWRPLDSQRWSETGPYDFYVTDWVGFEYQPWQVFQLVQVDELVLTIKARQGQGAIRVAMWDWNSESWVVDEDLGWGDNRISQPGSLIGPGNAVRVRVEDPSRSGLSVGQMDVTFRGGTQ